VAGRHVKTGAAEGAEELLGTVHRQITPEYQSGSEQSETPHMIAPPAS
jgi:hypothetical protein